jgi:SAM-dependent methyltransferase
MRCKICGGPTSKYASYGKFELEKCRECGFGQTNVTPDDIRDFYESAYFSGDTARFSQSHEEEIDQGKKGWIDKFVQGQDISCLEIGPGPAAMVPGYLAKTRSRLSYEAVEVSRDASEQLRERGFVVHTGKIYDDDIGEAVSGRFDYVVATEVIEHDLNPMKFVSGMFDALRPGGRACLTTGNFDGMVARFKGAKWYYIDPPAHVVFYTPRSARRLFIDAGFRKVSVNCVGLSYIRRNQRFPIPGLLQLVHALQLPTGMTIYAEK